MTEKISSKSISDLEQSIRDLVNRPRQKSLLTQDDLAWITLCSALDVVGDTCQCIASYDEIKGESDGATYLKLYGILQALYLQQDAVAEIYKILTNQKEYKRSKSLNTVREARNASVGHPVKRDRKSPQTSHFIVRFGMSDGGFKLHTYDKDMNFSDEFINIQKLIATQNEELVKDMTFILDKLQQDEKMHKDEHKNKLLADIFHPTWTYMISKMYEGTSRNDQKPIGVMGLNSIKKTADEIKAELKSREEYHQDSGCYTYIEELDYPFQCLKAFYNNDDASINEKDAHIFVFFVEGRMQKLLQCVKEVDAEYQD